MAESFYASRPAAETHYAGYCLHWPIHTVGRADEVHGEVVIPRSLSCMVPEQ
jgi:hypothetical protein